MRRAIVVLLAMTVLAGFTSALRGNELPFRSPSHAPPAELATPVLSIRRFAPMLVDFRARAKLKSSLDNILDDPAMAPWSKGSCLIAMSGDRVLYARRADMPVAPASTLKLLTATAALRVLGPTTRLTTVIRADQAASGGVITGDLQVVGGGDPIIQSDEFAAKNKHQPVVRTRIEDIAKAIQSAGVTHVTGGIRADESRYDSERARPGWKASYQQDGNVALLSALVVDDGQMANNKPATNSALQFSQVLTDKLRAIGVAVDGPPTVAKAGTGPVVASYDGLPVEQLVGEMLRESDNTTAELLMKEIGRRSTGGDSVGTTDAGLTAARTALTGAGFDLKGLVEKDASGLDRSDRATCTLLHGAVAKAGRRSTIADALPIAGKTGTLDKRFNGSSVEGRLRAKTGTLTGVSALAGWVDPVGDGTPVSFAVVSNDVAPNLVVTKLTDRVGLALGAWPAGPVLSVVEPEPLRSITASQARQ